MLALSAYKAAVYERYNKLAIIIVPLATNENGIITFRLCAFKC